MKFWVDDRDYYGPHIREAGGKERMANYDEVVRRANAFDELLACIATLRASTPFAAENADRLLAKYAVPGAEFGPKKPRYYQCGICDSYHSAEWNGDCREDDARFFADQLDEKHGPYGWDEVPMPGTEDKA
jgi:hypothetical protein